MFRHVPNLLAACVYNDYPAQMNLRLVCKEASQVALLSLLSFTVQLNDEKGYANINAARMVKHAQLLDLRVALPWTGECLQKKIVPPQMVHYI